MSHLWDEINLKGHNVIEASAGTGKTYTIEHLVLRLLCSSPNDGLCVDEEGQPRRINLDDLLVVTYTDKATEELKHRIRSKIEQELDSIQTEMSLKPQVKELVQHLRANLALIDQASIQTIHGFCHSVLKTYAFEAGLSIGDHIVSDAEGLSDELRRQWRKCSTEQSHVLAKVIKSERGIQNIITWAQYLMQDNVILRNDAGENETKRTSLDILERHLNEQINHFLKALPELQSRLTELLSRSSDFEERGGDDMIPYLKKYLTLQDAINEIIRSKAGFQKIKLGRAKLSTLPKKKSAKDVVSGESIFKEVVALWEPLAAKASTLESASAMMGNIPSLRFALQMAEAWVERKQMTGSISFDDMISHLSQALRGENSALTQRLQERYTYGIIDEFQDTDGDQWQIFDTLFRKRPEDNPGCLTVVGDPKQAIYSFRGADLNTYLRATRCILKENKQKSFILGHNFRSTKSMIEAGNSIFQTAQWFDAQFTPQPKSSEAEQGHVENSTLSGVDYLEAVESGKPELSAFGSPRWTQASTHLCDLTSLEDKSASSLRHAYTHWVCERIKALVPTDESPSLYLPDTDQNGTSTARPLERADIAILFQSRTEAKPLQRMLTQVGIPWRQYKQEGLLTSDASFQWTILLEAICSPDDEQESVRKVLMGWFFDPALSMDHDGLPSISARQQLQALRALAEKQQWAILLKSALERSGIEQRLLAEPDGDRNLSDLRQIRDALLKHLLLGGEGLADLARWLRRAAQGEDDRGISNIHHLESDRSKVVFITMHSSKGLEFPITFILPSQNYTSRGNCAPIPLGGDDPRRWFNLDDKEAGDYHKTKEQEEWARLLYVAFTRGVYLQFAPIYPNNSQKEPIKWPYSAIQHVSQRKVKSHFHIESPTDAVELETVQKPKMVRAKVEQLQQKGHVEYVREWQQRARKVLSSCRIQSSFSGLQSASLHRLVDDREFNRAQEPEQDEQELPSIPSTLPKGKNSGNFLHELLEKEDWLQLSGRAPLSHLQKEDLHRRIEDKLLRHSLGLSPDKHALLSSRRQEAQEIVKNLLNCPIKDPVDGESFCLADLPTSDRIPELEFLLAMDKEGRPLRPEPQSEHSSPSNSSAHGWLLGFIDLVFRRPIGDGSYRYFILDWKSNTLPQYQQTEIQYCMEEHHYTLQSDIYAHALDCWLQSRLGQHYHRQQHFGGSIYAFVRGQREQISPESFYIRPYNEQDLEQVSKTIGERFRHLQHRMESNL